MALSDLKQMSWRQLNALEGAELKRAFKSVSASLRGRMKGFKNAGKETAFTKKYKSGIRKASSFESEADMLDYVKQGLSDILGVRSTISGYNKAETERRMNLESSLGYHFKTDAEYDRFGKFMSEMGTRLGEAWKAISDVAWELFKESERLNLDPTQLMKNYEYWAEHLEDLQEAEPMKRGRDLRPSDYLKKLKLEKVSDFYKRELSESPEDFREYSSRARKPSRGRKAKKGK